MAARLSGVGEASSRIPRSLLARVVSRVEKVDGERSSRLYLDDSLIRGRPNVMGVLSRQSKNRPGRQDLALRRIELLAHAISEATAQNRDCFEPGMGVRSNFVIRRKLQAIDQRVGLGRIANQDGHLDS